MILLTGGTGYVGGRLLARLEREGRPVRCLVRSPEKLRGRGGPKTQILQGDVTDRESLDAAMEGVDAAYYLVHSMGEGESFRETDRLAAWTFGAAAKAAGVRRIVYLGGLGKGKELSEHLESRHEVGRILRESGIPTVEFRAAVVLGAGSLSFELVRDLVNRLPVMVTPRWVRVKTQPIAIDDVVEYLAAALDLPLPENTVYEIGGADRVSYLDLMKEYARQTGRRRLFIPVPVLTPWLSSLWLALVTPVQSKVGRKLIEGVRNETVVTDDRALRDFPAIGPLSMEEAVRRALQTAKNKRTS